MSDSVQLIHAAQAIDLPPGWSSATIEGLVGKEGVFVDGDWVESKDQDPTGGVRLIQLADIGDGEYRNRSDRFLTHERALELGCTFLNRGDVLIARMPDPLGRACLFPGDRKKSVTVVDVAIVRSGKGEFNHRWLMYFINAPAFRTSVASLQSGSTRKRISRGNLARISLPVPPREQQDRIVEEIEKQFSRLDEAVANLKRVKANLKRYKAAVLKAAVEGKLTEEWRKQHPNVEPAGKLLECILAERSKKWNGRGKYKEPNVLDTSDLPKLPDIWTWVTWDSVLAIGEGAFKRGPFGSALKKSIFVPRGYKVYEQYCPINDDCSFGRYYVTPEKFEELRSFEVKAGDFLISCSGVTLGRITQVPHMFEQGIINQALLRVRLNSKVIDDRYFVRLFRSNFFQRWIFDSSTGSAIPNVKGVKELKAIPIPLPPLVEQQQIVAELERRMSVIEELEAAVKANLSRADRLRQSILSQAFAGNLVCVNANREGRQSADIKMAKA